MPMLQVMRCPICNAQSDPADVPSGGWITVNVMGGTSRQETFDQWVCVRRYAANQIAAAEAEQAPEEIAAV